VRVSLRTKNKAEAKVRLVEKLFDVQKRSGRIESARMVDDDDDRELLFHQGLSLIERHGGYNPNNEFVRSFLMDFLSPRELEAYFFAYDHLEREKAREIARKAQLVAEERAILSGDRLASSVSLCPPGAAPVGGEPSSATTVPSSPGDPARRASTSDDLPIADAVARFIEHKTTANAATSEKYRSQCLLFVKLIEGPADRGLSSLTADDIRRYADILLKLPKKIAPKDPRTVEELLALEGLRLAPRTQFSHARAVNMFLEWCADQGYPVRPPFARILKPLLTKPKASVKEKSFTPDELRTIFGAQAYRKGSFRSASEYWLPLLALFTGARQAELCQLHRGDVRRDPETGIWIIDINDRGEKKLKQASSRRQVPIHSQLVALGFLDYHTAAGASASNRLFPDLQRNARGEFNMYSKRFNRFLDGLEIRTSQDTKKDFHSFRHTLSGYLTERGTDEYVVNAIIGHSQAGRSESVRTYGAGVSLVTKQRVIEGVDWRIDFERIARSAVSSPISLSTCCAPQP
jgi:integrase